MTVCFPYTETAVDRNYSQIPEDTHARTYTCAHAHGRVLKHVLAGCVMRVMSVASICFVYACMSVRCLSIVCDVVVLRALSES